MRARSLKPGFFANELLGSADPLYGTLFQGLWCMADREGRLEDRPLRISGQIFPYRRNVTEKKVEGMLRWLSDNGFIVRFEVGGRRYIQIVEFLKHQNPHKNEAPSKIPALSSILHSASTVQSTESAPCENGRGSVRVPSSDGTTRASSLTPDSLTPHSLTPDSSLRENARASVPRETAEGASSVVDLLATLKAEYPTGIYRQADWLIAEREICARLDEGHAHEALLAGCQRYAAQVRAKGGEGSQFVTAPSRFFRERQFLEPFPLPAKRLTATEELLANIDRGRSADSTVIEHDPSARTAATG